MPLKRGMVITVSFPFTGLSMIKRRPALVLLVHGDDLVVCGMTSKLSGRRDAIRIDEDDMAEGRLPKRSEIRPLKLFTLHHSLVHSVVGRLKDETLAQVVRFVTRSLSA